MPYDKLFQKTNKSEKIKIECLDIDFFSPEFLPKQNSAKIDPFLEYCSVIQTLYPTSR